MWLYLASLLVYIAVSLSFLYPMNVGWGILCATFGVAVTFLQRFLFLRYYEKLE